MSSTETSTAATRTTLPSVRPTSLGKHRETRYINVNKISSKRHVGGQRDLEDILKAYAFFNPEVGYCQGMGMVTGMMMMHMEAENAFWLLVATLDSKKYANSFYDTNLSQIKKMATVYGTLLKSRLPKLAAHLVN